MRERLRYWVWLSQCFSYGSGKLGRLVEAGADPEKLCLDGREYRKSFGFLDENDLNRLAHVSIERADLILEDCEKKKIWAVSIEDALHPPPLRHIYGPPVVLYGKGELTGLSETLRVTIVGTRECSDYAKSAAGNIAFQLARTGVTVVSGCAVGIDEYAHRGAVKAGGRSVGILACGADVNYPRDTETVRDHMLYRGGALITELPPGTHVNRNYFATRNRLLAGISEGVFVVQAPQRSGALITAELAVEQGKELFCLPPANIFDPNYLGVVPYLRDGAVPVYSAADILSEYEAQWADRINLEALHKPVRPAAQSAARVADEPAYQAKPAPAAAAGKAKASPPSAAELSLSDALREIYALLEDAPRPMDEIIRQSGKQPPEVLAALTELELLGLVTAYPGRLYGRADGAR